MTINNETLNLGVEVGQIAPVSEIPAVQPQQSAQVAIATGTFNLPIITQPKESIAIVQNNLTGFEDAVRLFSKIKMPGGGGLSFEITEEDGKPTAVTELTGIVIHAEPYNAWYEQDYDKKDENDLGIPDCSGVKRPITFVDELTGEQVTKALFVGSGCERVGIQKGQLCDNCPKGQWGSDRNGGSGKDCANKIRVYLLREGNILPDFIDLPPTSVRNYLDYIGRLTKKLRPIDGVVTTIRLEKAESTRGKKPFSKAVFAYTTSLTPQEHAAIKQYADSLRPAMRQLSKESMGDPSPLRKDDVATVDINKLDFDSGTGSGTASGATEQVF